MLIKRNDILLLVLWCVHRAGDFTFIANANCYRQNLSSSLVSLYLFFMR